MSGEVRLSIARALWEFDGYDLDADPDSHTAREMLPEYLARADAVLPILTARLARVEALADEWDGTVFQGQQPPHAQQPRKQVVMNIPNIPSGSDTGSDPVCPVHGPRPAQAGLADHPGFSAWGEIATTAGGLVGCLRCGDCGRVLAVDLNEIAGYVDESNWTDPQEIGSHPRDVEVMAQAGFEFVATEQDRPWAEADDAIRDRWRQIATAQLTAFGWGRSMSEQTVDAPRHWLCPNEPRCPHGAILHDVEEYAGDGTDTCCADGCDCRGPALAPSEAGA